MIAAAKRLVGRSYRASKQYELFRMRRRGAPVVVFSMGKTGSTAIARAVQSATGTRVFQVFRLDAERLAQAEQRYRANRKQASASDTSVPSAGVPFPGALHLWESEYLLRHGPTPAAPWTVITTVREPIGQAISAFFHGSLRRDLPAVPAAETLATLLEERWEQAPLRWFDREFAPALGIDVFDRPFDPALGHAVIETPSVRVLLLRQENLAGAPSVLADFLGRGAPVAVPARNQAAVREYGDRYRQFLEAVRVPDAVLDEVYGSRYAGHFYADSELTRLRRRWRSGPDAG